MGAGSGFGARVGAFLPSCLRVPRPVFFDEASSVLAMRHSFTLMTFSHIVASRLTVAQHPCDNGSCLGLRHGRYLSGRLQPAGTADTTRS